ncbi:hypothetical protein B0H13DRAFT_2417579 [Mycena leptocephala]|nr:hypothetical protein B0H13DRAFT_2417579 [Mycena leptocephala]
MRLCANLLLSLAAALLARAQADNALSVNGLSSVARLTDPALSVNGLSFVPAAPTFPLSLSWGLTYIPVPTGSSSSSSGSASGSTKSNKGKIAGGVIAAPAVLFTLLLTAAFLVRRRSKASTTHWRNRMGGWTWHYDAEGAAPPNSPGAGAAKFAPSGMGQVPKPFISQPVVGYNYWQDIKAPVASPVRPLFVRESRIGQGPDAVSVPGHKRQGSSGSNPTPFPSVVTFILAPRFIHPVASSRCTHACSTFSFSSARHLVLTVLTPTVLPCFHLPPSASPQLLASTAHFFPIFGPLHQTRFPNTLLYDLVPLLWSASASQSQCCSAQSKSSAEFRRAFIPHSVNALLQSRYLSLRSASTSSCGLRTRWYTCYVHRPVSTAVYVWLQAMGEPTRQHRLKADADQERQLEKSRRCFVSDSDSKLAWTCVRVRWDSDLDSTQIRLDTFSLLPRQAPDALSSFVLLTYPPPQSLPQFWAKFVQVNLSDELPLILRSRSKYRPVPPVRTQARAQAHSDRVPNPSPSACPFLRPADSVCVFKLRLRAVSLTPTRPDAHGWRTDTTGIGTDIHSPNPSASATPAEVEAEPIAT